MRSEKSPPSKPEALAHEESPPSVTEALAHGQRPPSRPAALAHPCHLLQVHPSGDGMLERGLLSHWDRPRAWPAFGANGRQCAQVSTPGHPDFGGCSRSWGLLASWLWRAQHARVSTSSPLMHVHHAGRATDASPSHWDGSRPKSIPWGWQPDSAHPAEKSNRRKTIPRARDASPPRGDGTRCKSIPRGWHPRPVHLAGMEPPAPPMQ